MDFYDQWNGYLKKKFNLNLNFLYQNKFQLDQRFK